MDKWIRCHYTGGMAQNVSTRMEDELVAKVDRLAAAFGTTRSKVISWATAETIARVEVEQAEAQSGTRPPGIPTGLAS